MQFTLHPIHKHKIFQTAHRSTHASWHPGRAARCSAVAVPQCAPSSQSARLQWASPSARLRANVSTDLRAADPPPQTPSDTSSACPQQDARGKERACGTAEHFSGEHRPAFKWWVRASEQGLFWGVWSHWLAARTWTLLEYSVFLCQCNQRINTHSHFIPMFCFFFCTDGVYPLFKTARAFMTH